ncbi:hypothetical protein T05_13487 [Trichinella murrelli]|uniref:Uncharacterized protein n=1 Tax=Trichinella murrelli TaxID=144512 RepID=A0A0V0TA30_9BILA|nr:hypothetical protein T05_13487 [Trichinella murrelli]
MKLLKLADDYDWETLDAEVPGYTNSYVVDRLHPCASYTFCYAVIFRNRYQEISAKSKRDDAAASPVAASISERDRAAVSGWFVCCYPNTRRHTPSRQVLMERTLRTCLDQILPNKTKLAQQKVTPTRREFKKDNHVFARCYNELDKWSKAQIVDWADCSTWFVLKLAWY